MKFWVSGNPATKGSWRQMRSRKTGKAFLVPDNRSERGWAESVGWEAKRALMGCGTLPVFHERPVCMKITFYVDRPKQPAHDWPRGDVDKYARSAMDALSKGLLYTDDSQVTRLSVHKCWAGKNGPGAQFRADDPKQCECCDCAAERAGV